MIRLGEKWLLGKNIKTEDLGEKYYGCEGAGKGLRGKK